MIRRPPRSTLFPTRRSSDLTMDFGTAVFTIRSISVAGKLLVQHFSPTVWHGACATDCSPPANIRSEEHTSELQSQSNLVCRLLLEKKKKPAFSLCTRK